MSTHDKINDPKQQLGDAIRHRRVAANLSQELMAMWMDCHRNYIGQVERGEINISIVSLIKFATVFGCKPSDLLREAGL